MRRSSTTEPDRLGGDSVDWVIPAQPEAATFLAELRAEDREVLQSSARPRRFPAGATLMHEGQAGTDVMLIGSGRVKIRCVAIDGQEIVLDFRGPGELVGELAVIDGEPRSSSVEAIEPVEVLAVEGTAFKALIAGHAGIADALLRDVVRRFRDADRKRIEFGASNTIGRVAARLVEMVERFGSRSSTGYVIELPISQDELAGWTGSSREAVAKALRSLRELRLITTERRRITVLDLEGLGRHRR